MRVERALDDATIPRCGRPPSYAPRPPRSRRVGRTGSVPTWRQGDVVRVWVGRRPCTRRGGVHGRDDGGRRWRLFWRQYGHAPGECRRRWGLVRAATLPRPRQRSPGKSKHCGCAAPRRHRLHLQATDDEDPSPSCMSTRVAIAPCRVVLLAQEAAVTACSCSAAQAKAWKTRFFLQGSPTRTLGAVRTVLCRLHTSGTGEPGSSGMN